MKSGGYGGREIVIRVNALETPWGTDDLIAACDAIDGVVNHTALETAMSKVPNARFEDATDVIGMARYVKSAEEIQFVRRSAEVAAAGADELIKLARPGVDAGMEEFNEYAGQTGSPGVHWQSLPRNWG